MVNRSTNVVHVIETDQRTLSHTEGEVTTNAFRPGCTVGELGQETHVVRREWYPAFWPAAARG
jgi:hypothetical protein